MANPTTNFGWVMPTSTSLVTNLPADFNTFGQAVDTSMSELLGGTTGQVLSKTSNTNMDFTWVTPTDQTPLTTKGDLFAFSTVDARLAVGANETRLVADSTQTVGLKYVADTTNYAINAKGDLLAGTAADTLQALSVGTNGQTLVADSTASTGLKWATPSSGGMTLISTTTIGSGVSSTSLPASTFTSTYTNYKFIFTSVTSTSANITITMRLRSGSTDETSASYSANGYKSTGTLAQYGSVNQTSQEIGSIRTGFAERTFISGEIYRPQESAQTMYATNFAIDVAGTFTNFQQSGLLNTSTSYDSMSFIYTGGTVTGGKISVYGYSI